jgi:transposase
LNQRLDDWLKLQMVLAKDLIFIDESGVNLALTRMRARSPKGKRAYGKRPHKRGKNVSLLTAIGLQGVLAEVSLLGSVKGLTFEAFIATKLVPQLWPGACVIMDNCSIHFSQEIEDMIRAAGARLIYLPPYSHDFSPIENFWSKVKSTLRSIGARTYRDLVKAIEKAYSQISQQDIKNWFTHCCYCTELD